MLSEGFPSESIFFFKTNRCIHLLLRENFKIGRVIFARRGPEGPNGALRKAAPSRGLPESAAMFFHF